MIKAERRPQRENEQEAVPLRSGLKAEEKKDQRCLQFGWLHGDTPLSAKPTLLP